MPPDMPAGGYVSDVLLFVYVAATLALFAVVAWRRSRREGASRLATWSAWTLAASVVAAMFLLCGELYYRYVFDAPNDHVPTLTDRAWYLRHYGPELNSAGFRDDEWGPKRSGVPRVLIVGSEIVAGVGLTDRSQRVDARLSERLASQHETISVGQPAWSLADQVAWTKANIDRLQPDVVVFLVEPSAIATVVPPPTRPTWWNPARSFLLDRWWLGSLEAPHRVPGPMRRDFEKSRFELGRLMTSSNARVVEIRLPWLYAEKPQDGALASYMETVDQSGRLNELSSAVKTDPARLRVSDDCARLNAKGHDVLAEAIRQLVWPE